ncbi:hypothetical protein TNCV_836451 [Trichonephila clavipes]|nr:hypothetical protein TNCV_836451 [Trichonephila clavipes]
MLLRQFSSKDLFPVREPMTSHNGHVVLNGEVTKTGEYRRLVTYLVEWIAQLTAVPEGLGSNPGEDMDVCKCIVPLRHGGILNSRRAASPFVRLVEEKER